MFYDNKYTRIYYNIIQNCQALSGETHHIIPKSLGGTDEDSNLVTISPKAHFILHKLLCKMVIKEKHLKSMNYALFMMMNRKISNFTSREYNILRSRISEQMRLNNPMHNPEVSKKFRKKRPDQSKVATKRNTEYWKKNARPLRKIKCEICTISIETRIPTQHTCSRTCYYKLLKIRKVRDSVSRLPQAQ